MILRVAEYLDIAYCTGTIPSITLVLMLATTQDNPQAAFQLPHVPGRLAQQSSFSRKLDGQVERDTTAESNYTNIVNPPCQPFGLGQKHLSHEVPPPTKCLLETARTAHYRQCLGTSRRTLEMDARSRQSRNQLGQ